jgi:hypothetical protein
MTVYVVQASAYHRVMSDDGLPHPTEALTLSALAVAAERVIAMLDQGGGVLVYTDDRERLLGVLTREPRLFGEAQMAAMIDAGTLPPLDELVAMDDRGELP